LVAGTVGLVNAFNPCRLRLKIEGKPEKLGELLSLMDNFDPHNHRQPLALAPPRQGRGFVDIKDRKKLLAITISPCFADS